MLRTFASFWQQAHSRDTINACCWGKFWVNSLGEGSVSGGTSIQLHISWCFQQDSCFSPLSFNSPELAVQDCCQEWVSLILLDFFVIVRCKMTPSPPDITPTFQAWRRNGAKEKWAPSWITLRDASQQFLLLYLIRQNSATGPPHGTQMPRRDAILFCF